MAIVAAGLYAAGRVVGPEEMGLETFPATVVRLLAYGAAGVFVGWLSESRVGLVREVAQQDRTLVELRTIQETLSPPEPEARPGLRLATCYLPAEDGVAGDFYLVTKGMGDSTVIAIGDVAGRGLEAAKRAWFVRTVLASSADFTEDPAEMLDLANYSLIEESGASSLFVTAACIVFQPEDRSIRWAVAGHEPPLLLDRGDPLGSRPSSGVPLGIGDSLGCATASSSLDLGSGLLLYTDGVIEARGVNGALGRRAVRRPAAVRGGRRRWTARSPRTSSSAFATRSSSTPAAASRTTSASWRSAPARWPTRRPSASPRTRWRSPRSSPRATRGACRPCA